MFCLVGVEGLDPRPSPCKGERNMQVRPLSRQNAVTASTREYLGLQGSPASGDRR
jgi:hypothetical protein